MNPKETLESIIMLSTSSPSGIKRDFATMDNSDINSVGTQCTNNIEKSITTKERKSKKFRVEWMEEEHFRDWLQPYPGDDTMCACIACDIVLRCGKSELYKHASGLKHTKRIEEMKSGTSRRKLIRRQDDGQTVRLDQYLKKEEEHVWIPVQTELSVEGNCETIDENGTIGCNLSPQKEKPSSDAKLTEALVKLFEFADGKIDLSRKRLEMLHEEHSFKIQILQKELLLKTLEVEIKEAELKKLKLELDQSSSKDNHMSPNSQITLHEHPTILTVPHSLQLQEALQTQLQQLQGHFHQGQETKERTVTLT